MLINLAPRIGLKEADTSASTLLAEAAQMTWTRDPFDRLICAHAAVAGADLATKDRMILQNFARAVW